MNKDSIVLIGFMGSGKTTVGKWIAENQGYIFVDTDELIEAKEGRTINEIFATDGEEYFRNLETQVIGGLAEDDRKLVISVGGGLPVREENRKLMRRAGRVVYLNTSVDELERRLKGDTTRPLLAGSGLRKKITDLMEKREKLYLDAADVVVDTENRTFEEIYNLI
jgi:shikimate kinase